MEKEKTPNMQVDMYDVIFKTIYLFLETNAFHETATSFIGEIKHKFDIDITGTNARTLILRPCMQEQEKFSSASPHTNKSVPVQTSSKVQSIATEVIDDVPKLSHNSCPDCQSIERVVNNLNEIRNRVNSEDGDAKDMRLLHKTLKLLKNLQKDHTKVIQLATDITNAISKLNDSGKEKLVKECHQQIYDFYSYPGAHSSIDVVLVLHNNQDTYSKLIPSEHLPNNRLDPAQEDKTDYDIDSSLNESSTDSKKNSIDTLSHVNNAQPSAVDTLSALSELVTSMSNKSTVPKSEQISSNHNEWLSYTENEDRRSPSRYGVDFLNTPRKKHVHSSKSATLPSVSLNTTTPIDGSVKSQSASCIGEARTKVDPYTAFREKWFPDGFPLSKKYSPGTSIKSCGAMSKLDIDKSSGDMLTSSSNLRTTRLSKSRSSAKLSIKNSLKLPRTRTNTPRATSSSKQLDDSELVNYNLMIKEKAKLILDKQRSVMESRKLNVTNSTMTDLCSIDTPHDKSESPTMPHIGLIDTTESYETEDSNYERMFHQKDKQMRLPVDINWYALKNNLYSGAPDVKMKILQALRWRLTDSNNDERDRHLLEYVKNDVLSINTVPPHGQLFMESFYCPKKTLTPHPLQEEMARFINTIASLSLGRIYLERDESLLSVMLLPLLAGKLPGIKINNLTREFSMATIQKLSLNNKMREIIIRSGTIEWLVGFIHVNHQRMSTYEAEYSTALLTNLCINTEARNRAERIADRVVSLLETLIRTPHTCCHPYINPILYSLLLNPIINEKATARGIGIKLKRLYQVYGDDEDLKRQLDPIIAMHESHDFCDCEDQEPDELSYSDYLEPELSQRDPIYPTPIGEEFLQTFNLMDSPTNDPNQKDELKSKSPAPSAHIVKKACLYDKSNHHLQELSPHLSPVSPMPNKWQTRPTRSTLVAEHLPTVKISHPPKTTVIKKPMESLRIAPRQRSFSQPPIKRAPLSQPTKANKDKVFKPPPPPRKPPQPPQPSQIPNCSYKMDYVNAMAAPPGEFLPHCLTTSSPNLISTGGDIYSSGLDIFPLSQSDRVPEGKNCQCYKDMQQFIGDLTKTVVNESVHKMSTASLRRSSDNKNSDAGSQDTYHVFQMSENTEEDIVNYFPKKNKGNTYRKSKRRDKAKAEDYHLVTHDASSVILKTYEDPKMINKFSKNL